METKNEFTYSCRVEMVDEQRVRRQPPRLAYQRRADRSNSRLRNGLDDSSLIDILLFSAHHMPVHQQTTARRLQATGFFFANWTDVI
jgi:hypothetical protein